MSSKKAVVGVEAKPVRVSNLFICKFSLTNSTPSETGKEGGSTFNISFQQPWKEAVQGANEAKEKTKVLTNQYNLNHVTVVLHGEI